ncbi:hypothetical protein [Nitrosopumilus sp.]|uniref:hypothetical protein n=1 Tax=Nitrosopumilus sp. TaxID=2024843 RepID=UPI002626C01F|nr:hypothetical protein [Nitrosopumilus sp.]
MDKLVQKITTLKQEFVKAYTGNAHIQEILPLNSSDSFNIDSDHLRKLHEFATKNPIYYNHYEEKVSDTSCIVYEGDINQYWLNSIKHGSSCQPFYPTWMISAYLMSNIAKSLGCRELVDIGSGDGRIAYSGKILDMITQSIEIDEMLVDLQNVIVAQTNQNFDPTCNDALEFDYSQLELTSPAFFIGGLPQMGGDLLATSIIEKIKGISDLKENTCIVFAGTHAKRQLSNNLDDGGWSDLIDKHNLKVIQTASLPAVWTFDQKVETPYIFTKFN